MIITGKFIQENGQVGRGTCRVCMIAWTVYRAVECVTAHATPFSTGGGGGGGGYNMNSYSGVVANECKPWHMLRQEDKQLQIGPFR